MDEKQYKHAVWKAERLAALIEALEVAKDELVKFADYEKAAQVRDWLTEARNDSRSV